MTRPSYLAHPGPSGMIRLFAFEKASSPVGRLMSDPVTSRRSFLVPRPRFNLVWLVIAIVVVLVVLGAASSFRDLVGSLFFVSVCCVLPTPLVVAAIFGRGDIQTFAIGALVPWITLLPWLSSMFIWLLILPILCGTLAVVTRRWLRLFGGV